MQCSIQTLSLVVLTSVAAANAGKAQAHGGSLPAVHLTPSTVTLAAGEGGEQVLRLDAGTGRAGAPYLTLGTASGTAPGFRLGSVLVPLNPDWYLLSTAGAGSPLLIHGTGRLDARGHAHTSVRVPPAIAQLLSRRTLHHATLVFGADAVAASNAVPLRFTNGPGPTAAYTISIAGPVQHTLDSSTTGWLDRTGSSVFPNTRATVSWLTTHFGGQCFVDPNQVYESSFAVHEGKGKNDAPIFAHFFPHALDRNGNPVKYRLELLGDVTQGTYPPAPSSTTVIEFPQYTLVKDSGKANATCQQKEAITFPGGAKVVITLSR